MTSTTCPMASRPGVRYTICTRSGVWTNAITPAAFWTESRPEEVLPSGFLARFEESDMAHCRWPIGMVK